MIACLKGKVIAKTFDKTIIDVNGVGYEVHITRSVFSMLPDIGQETFLHVLTHVREDALTLFGFSDTDEKSIFLILMGVSGIGPKLALGILSGIRPAELARAISSENIGRLTQLSGVGKKTAERLCLELKDKIDLPPAQPESPGRPGLPEESDGRRISDVISALINLGYPETRANEALNSVQRRLSDNSFSNMPLEELLRRTLGALV
ncbi:MAG: Holliday junction branch migration protein RuvA [Thermodesulfobacteriota bacterium]|nr:Holliday junction branch migration protein RuvA [Thermodesulfobacteriota bacterium]